MPSSSQKQHNFMAMIANNPKAAKKAGVAPSVGEDFMKADKGKSFGKGAASKQGLNNPKTNHGGMKFFAEGGAPKPAPKQTKPETFTPTPEELQAIKDAKERAAFSKVPTTKTTMGEGLATGGKVNPFKGKEAPSEEKKEKKLPPWLYAKGEKSEGEKPKGKPFARGGSVRRFDEGGVTEGQNANIGDDTRARAMARIAALGLEDAASAPAAPVARPRFARRSSPAAPPGVDPRMLEAGMSRGARPAPAVDPALASIAAARASGEIPGDVPSQQNPDMISRLRGAVRNAMPGNSPMDSLSALAPGVAQGASRAAAGLAGLAVAGLRAGKQEATAARSQATIRMAQQARAREAAARYKDAEAMQLAKSRAEVSPPMFEGGYKKGGLVRNRDGLAQRGKTKGAMR